MTLFRIKIPNSPHNSRCISKDVVSFTSSGKFFLYCWYGIHPELFSTRHVVITVEVV